MIQAVKKAAYSHGYLIITAAWLYTISFVFANYWSYNSSLQKAQTTLQHSIAKEENHFNEIIKNKGIVSAIISDSANEVKTKLSNETSGLFVYELNDKGNPVQVFWSTNKMSIAPEDLLKTDGNYAVQYHNGFFELIKKTVEIKGKNYFFTNLIPIRWDYFIENKYLRSEFAGFPEIEKLYQISKNNSGTPVKNSKGIILFKIEKKPNVFVYQSNIFSITLRVLAILFFLAFIHFLASDIVIQKNFASGFIFLITVIIILRYLTYQFNFPFAFRNFELFDPEIYASNNLHPSLGDLLINSILFFWIIGFIKFSNRFWNDEKKWNPKYSKIIAVIALALLVFFAFSISNIILSLVTDSKISFDVTNFFGLSIYTFIGFVILCFLVLSFYYLSHLLITPSFKAGLTLYWRIIIVTIAGLLFLTFNAGAASTGFRITILIWLITYVFLISYRKKDMLLSVFNSSFFLLWAAFFAASATALISFQNRVVELEQRKKIADKLVMETDPEGESLLSMAITYFPGDFLQSDFYRFKSEYTNKFIKDSLISKNYSGYLNKYDTRIYTFDKDFNPLFNEDSTSYHVLKSIISNKGKITTIPNLFYYGNEADKFSYLYENTIKDRDSAIQGYLIVVVKPKQYKSEALYPELFKQTGDISSDLNINYAYAVYNKGQLINSSGNYDFTDSLSNSKVPKIQFEQRVKNSYNELWYNAGNNKVVIIAKKDAWLMEYISLFAYVFCLFILLVALLHFGNHILRTRFKLKNIRQLFYFNIRTQIHTTIIFVSIFSFLVIGAATISFFIVRFNSDNEERLSKSIQIMAAEIETKIKSLLVFDDALNVTDIGYNSDLERTIIEISEIHEADVNFYDVNGNLLVSTQPYIYDKQILSEKMEPKAYDELHYNRSIKYIQQEYIGKFSYLSIYVPIKEEGGAAIAYLNIPYLNSQSELNSEISNFLVTLINLNALIFVIAGAIALLLTNRITDSFSLIGNKMKQINLGKMNEEIVWNSHDEIGALVNEYNKMVKKLEESAQALARSEREEAWREMARQVAHEIKNPLTPMKLSIQYLQKSVNDGATNVKDLSQKVATTLIEQIDQLSKIAGDFSQFANIGNVSVEIFDVTEVLQSLINLYRSYTRLHIQWKKEKGSFKIAADKMQINRLFTNLIKNAIEASDPNKKIKLIISQYKENENVIISVEDNGTGISANMQQKIFTPNFTTKSSGTGLGLAICKGIVENSNGKIWFTTKENEGTIFYVSLLLINE
ncbi:MAG: ATP-binding protein [Chitinophagaceae bacterium]